VLNCRCHIIIVVHCTTAAYSLKGTPDISYNTVYSLEGNTLYDVTVRYIPLEGTPGMSYNRLFTH
jgi:hypothetical protein